jgi:hypothetical protein
LENEQNEEADGREDVEEVNEEENDEGEIEENEEQMIIPEPTNLKCLEMDEQVDEAMSTGEEDEEEDEDDVEDEDELLERKKTQNLHMRVFVQRNNAQIFQRGRHFPSSRSDSQLLWNRNSSGQASRAPPPPAPFPLEEGEEEMMESKDKRIWRNGGGRGGGMAHSRTYGGFMGGMEEDEQNGKTMMNYGEDDEEEEMEIQERLDELEMKVRRNLGTNFGVQILG